MQHLSLRRRWKLPHYFDAREIQTGKVEFDPVTCTACGRCARSCPVGSIIVPKASERTNNPAHVLEARPDLFLCFACANCFTVCPENAVTVSRRYTAHFYFNRLFRTSEMTPPRKY
jgi:formate hydrogenlyase subunit 6/NADH:ubiquinone oxidoreductase subunit I